jgi:hypothetical protein
MFALILFCSSSLFLFVLFHFFDASKKSSSNEIYAANLSHSNSSQSNKNISNDKVKNTLNYLPTIRFTTSLVESQKLDKKQQACKNIKQIIDNLRESLSPYCKYFGLEGFEDYQRERLINKKSKETIGDKYKY